MMNNLRASVMALTMVLMPAALNVAQAQPAPPQGAAAAPFTDATVMLGMPDDQKPWPVLRLTSLELIRSTQNGGLDIIRVRGVTSSAEWSNPQILPITTGVGSDGMLDVIFQASPPKGLVGVEGYMVVEALLPIESGHPYRGIRARSATNAITLKTLPGYIEAPAAPEECVKCVGKYFLAKGATAPAGIAAADILREADLIGAVRVLRPADGIASYAIDPNRLTLLLSEDGRIMDAGWN